MKAVDWDNLFSDTAHVINLRINVEALAVLMTRPEWEARAPRQIKDRVVAMNLTRIKDRGSRMVAGAAKNDCRYAPSGELRCAFLSLLDLRILMVRIPQCCGRGCVPVVRYACWLLHCLLQWLAVCPVLQGDRHTHALLP